MATTNKVCVVCLGGLGLQTRSRIMKAYGNEKDVDMSFAVFDTSNSDAGDITSVPPQNVYLLNQKVTTSKIDGSGQKPAENYAIIQERKDEIVQCLPEADAYIVVVGIGGGSGSAFLRVIAPELIKRKERFVVIAVGDDTTAQFTQNTIRTLKAMHNMALEHGHITICYDSNQVEVPKAIVDKNVLELVSILSVFFSGVAERLDKADIYAFLNPDSKFGRPVTGVTNITFASRGTDELPTHTWSQPKSLLTITEPGKEVSVGSLSVHNCYSGSIPGTPEFESICSVLPVIALNSIGLVPQTIAELEKRHNELVKKLNSTAHLNVAAYSNDELI